MAKTPKNHEKYYFDASVILAWLNEEVTRVDIIADIFALAANKEKEIWTSAISIVEVAFSALERDKKALSLAVQKRIDTLWQPDSIIKLADISEFVVYDARDLIREAVKNNWSLKSHDSIHLATAKRLKVDEFHAYNGGYSKWDDKLGFKVKEPHVLQPTMGFHGKAKGAPKIKSTTDVK